MNELGKVAASQYELYLEKTQPRAEVDFSNSVRRQYNRQSMLTTLRPMQLFVQLDLSKVNDSSHQAFINDLVAVCKSN